MFPNGDKKNGGEGHISIFLRLVDKDSLPVGWEVNAVITFFLFDQIRDQYVTSQGTNFRPGNFGHDTMTRPENGTK